MNELEAYEVWHKTSIVPPLDESFDSYVKNLPPALSERFRDHESFQRRIYEALKEGMQFIHIESNLYPNLLKEIQKPPFGFFCVGDVSVLKERMFSIVGTRSSSAYGERIARKFASEISKHFVVVSGMAYGIDSKAHEGALENGRTIAVLASGADVPSPKGNTGLYRRIIEKGCALSPYPPGEEAKKHRFVERNAIIAGISLGTLVVEAPRKSGALITASFAADFGRDVFAIPGDIGRRGSEGTNWLIKVGALPVTSPSDILSHYGISASDEAEKSDPILEMIRNGIGDPAEISESLGMDLSEVLSRITELELSGLVYEENGEYRPL